MIPLGYELMRKELERDVERQGEDYIFYHGTSPEQAEALLQHGFWAGVHLGIKPEVCGVMATDWGALLRVAIPKSFFAAQDWSYNCLTGEVYVDQPVPPDGVAMAWRAP